MSVRAPQRLWSLFSETKSHTTRTSALGVFLSADLEVVFVKGFQATNLYARLSSHVATSLNPWQLPETCGGGRLEAGHPTNVGKIQGKRRIYLALKLQQYVKSMLRQRNGLPFTWVNCLNCVQSIRTLHFAALDCVGIITPQDSLAKRITIIQTPPKGD